MSDCKSHPSRPTSVDVRPYFPALPFSAAAAAAFGRGDGCSSVGKLRFLSRIRPIISAENPLSAAPLWTSHQTAPRDPSTHRTAAMQSSPNGIIPKYAAPYRQRAKYVYGARLLSIERVRLIHGATYIRVELIYRARFICLVWRGE